MTAQSAKRWPWVGLMVLILGLSVLAWPKPVTSQTTQPDLKLSQMAVHALGRLEPKSRILNVAAMSGSPGARIETLQVKEGQRVTAGEVLAVLDTEARHKASLIQAQAQLEVAQRQLERVAAGAKQGDIGATEAALKSAELARDLALKQLLRMRTLRAKKSVTQDQLDRSLLSWQQAEWEVKRAEQRLLAIKEVPETALALQSSQVKLAAAQLKVAGVQLETAYIRAPADGVVLKIHSRVGEQLAPEGLLELADIDQMQAVAEVFEGDLPRLSVGQRATVRLESADLSFKARVAELGYKVGRKLVLISDPISDTESRVVELRLDFDKEASRALRRLSNTRVHITIETQG